MTERSKELKDRKRPIVGWEDSVLIERHGECKGMFLIWAHTKHLDTAGMYHVGGEPIFRPAICAWEAWKAAWELRSAK